LKKNILFFFACSFLFLFFDQALKLWVFFEQCSLFPEFRTVPSFEYIPYKNRLNIELSSFLKIVYIENTGVAFGFLSNLGVDFKYFLTFFRLFAVVFISFFFVSIIKKRSVCLIGCLPFSLVFSGALGNLFDSVFYSFWGFNVGPVGSLFQGGVVDMLHFSFFPPVFNLADSFVCVGVFCLLFFQTNIVLKRKNSFWEDIKGFVRR
tara:strand:+ start:1293 stop:1910 length:618 start_codon:yes stop_codon:yes gene_type:complete